MLWVGVCRCCGWGVVDACVCEGVGVCKGRLGEGLGLWRCVSVCVRGGGWWVFVCVMGVGCREEGLGVG